MALQRSRNLIWDEIIREANKFRLYLDYIADQESSLKVARQNILIVKQGLNKKPMQVAQNAIKFLSTLSKDQAKRFGIQDKVIVASWAGKLIGKYRMLDTVQEKVDIISHKIKEVVDLLNPIVKR